MGCDLFVTLKGVDTNYSAVPEIIRQTHTVEFEDYFNGVLSPLYWNTRFLWGPDFIINKEEQYYVDVLGGAGWQGANPISFAPDGAIEINAAPITGTKPVATAGTPLPGGQNYSSAILTSRGKLDFRYGYYEMRAKQPPTTLGAWLAFWGLNTNYYDGAFDKNQAENGGTGHDKFNNEDDFEWVHGPGYYGSDRVKMAHHYFTGTKNTSNYRLWTLDAGSFRGVDRSGQGLPNEQGVYRDVNDIQRNTLPDHQGIDWADGYHDTGFHWYPNGMDYYVDGVLVNSIRANINIISDQFMYILANFAVGGLFPFGNTGALANPADWPQKLTIRHIRYWSGPNSTRA